MKVLFVINNLYTKGNGLCASARRTIQRLRDKGLEVEALSGANPDPNGPQPKFALKNIEIPIIDWFIKKQGYQFAESDQKVVKEAVEWADIIHLEEPFFIQYEVAKEAIKQNVPMTGTYHLHPENMFATAGLEQNKFFNENTLKLWRDQIFNKCKIIQCPTQNVYDRLKRFKFKPELRVISNGIVLEDLFHPDENSPKKRISDAKYQIIAIGRLSAEKNYITLLKAMKYSRNSRDIQLIFAGRGPLEQPLLDYSAELIRKRVIQYAPRFGFFSLEDLQQLAVGSDLYVHCATVEVEGLSCMEAIQTGLTPVIASGKLTATSQFALSSRSTYPCKNAMALANRIDYWLEHEEERKKEAKKYVGIGKEYDIELSIDALIKMFNDALTMQ